MSPLDKILKRFSKQPKLDYEAGVSTSLINQTIEEEVDRSDQVSIEDYRKMKNNDGTIRALYNIITLPILATGYYFKSKEDAEAHREFVEDALTRPPHLGGMTTPIGLLLRDMLRAVEDGYRAYYKVYTLNQDGKIVYRKISPRDPVTLTLLTDSHGGFNGARQRTNSGGRYVDEVLPVENMFLFTVNKDIDPLYGESFYKSARYHWDKKHRYYVIEELQAQAAAIPPRKLKVPKGLEPDKLSIVERAADRFGIRQRITLPEGYELEEYKTTPNDIQPAIAHHDQLMARSLLAQHITLTQGKGSQALSRDQSDFFLMSLEALMNDVESHINSYLIPDLINYNFADKKYPTFELNRLSDKTKTIVTEAFNEIVSKGNLPDYMLQGIVRDVAQQLDIEVPDEVEPVKEEKELSALQNIDPETLNARLDRLEIDFIRSARTIIEDVRTKTFDKARNITNLAELKELKLIGLEPYEKLLRETYEATYLMAKNGAADELDVRSPSTPKESKEFFKQQAKAIADKTGEELLFTLKSEIAKESRRKNLSIDLSITDALAKAAVAYQVFEENKTELAGATVVSTALNMGRSDVFNANKNAIDRYEYSALLDDRTTQICRDLDGSVITPDEYETTDWKPPVHFRCRSIWVAIRSDDTFKPDFRSMPSSPGGYSNPQLSVDVSAVSEQLDNWMDEVIGLQADLKESAIDKKKLKELEVKLDQLGE